MLNKFKKTVHLYRKLKLTFYSKRIKIGNNFKCGTHCSISRKNNIIIGDNFFMGRYCHLASDLIIMNNVMLGSFVAFVGGDHKIDNVDGVMNKSGRDTFKTTVIEDDVWIGHGSTIMHGVIIGTGSVIAAGSVVTKNVEKKSIVGGNPAKFIRYRKFNEYAPTHSRP